jgi:hypothetical protein
VGYIVSENNLTGTHTAPLVIPQMRYRLPEKVSPFGRNPITAVRSAHVHTVRLMMTPEQRHSLVR